MKVKQFIKSWWDGLRYEPGDPRINAGGKTIRIVTIGGGTGLSNLLRGLKKYSNEITAIVAVTDDGASSGELRREFDILPPGDIRKCISALAYDEDLISKLFEHRFPKNKKGLGGHTMGNIWITALTDYFGSFEKAIEATSSIFETAGTVLPATLSNVRLGANFTDGSQIVGETSFVKERKKIENVFLSRKNVRAYYKAALAIGKADLIIFGPGSLYTSIMPNILIAGIAKTIIKNQSATKIYIANCSTERGETENYTVDDHIEALQKHAKSKKIFDFCLVNNRVIKRSFDDYKLGQVNNITSKKDEISGVKIIKKNIVSNKNPLYHDSEKLAKAVIEMYNEISQKGEG